jgi:hypothetical protein
VEEIVNQYIARVEAALEKANRNFTKLEYNQLELDGMSSTKNRILLNELVADDTRYLEIGVFRGSTFVAALYKNSPKSAVAIDNFSMFGGTLEVFTRHCAENDVAKNMAILSKDCFELNETDFRLIDGTNVYFYDGQHREIDQEMALTYYIKSLADVFIYIVDDWNHGPAQTGTRKGIEKTNLKIHKEWILPADRNGDKAKWWNGFYVAICEKQS